MNKSATIVGSSGVIGLATSEHLLGHGWTVYGLSRGRTPQAEGVGAIHADLMDPDALVRSLSSVDTKYVFFTAWSRQASEAENIRVNGAMVSNVLNALGPKLDGGHVGLVTGLKHYLGPFESYGKGTLPQTPFKEEQGRLPVDNFYYEQEDRLFDASTRFKFSWSVHRPHTIIGYVLGNAMNMGVTLAVYATLCRELGRPMPEVQWQGVTDRTDAGLVAAQLEWAATSEGARNQAFNVVNGDVFRWKWMWPRIAAYFGVEARGYEREVRPLAAQMQDAAPLWEQIADRHRLRERDLSRLASWWHTDADLGRPIEAFTDMSKSRRAGFLEYRDTLTSFHTLFDRLKADHVVPA